jgi:hypothetical protein
VNADCHRRNPPQLSAVRPVPTRQSVEAQQPVSHISVAVGAGWASPVAVGLGVSPVMGEACLAALTRFFRSAGHAPQAGHRPVRLLECGTVARSRSSRREFSVSNLGGRRDAARLSPTSPR